ncbi:MAG: amidohydrolase family protein [Pseudomonadota bacterium]
MLRKLFYGVTGLLVVTASLVALLLVWPLPEIPQHGRSGDFLIHDVAVVDVESGGLRRNRDVVVRDGLIHSIGPAGKGPRDDALIAVNGAGKYLIPGLWDMHTHSTKLSAQYQHPLFVANGVTGVRELWGCMSEPDSFMACIDDRQDWNDALDEHSGLSPRYVGQSSFQINGGNEVPAGFPEFFKARNAEEARRLVDFYAGAGADILKTYSELSPEAYQALAEAARTQGLSLQGHRPVKVSFGEMLAAGQRSVEHPRLFLFECHAGAAEFRALDRPLAAYNPEFRRRLVDEHDEERCRILIEELADSDTWWTPTLQVLRIGVLAGDPAFRDDPRLKYVPYLFRELMWMPDADRKAADAHDESGRNVYAAMYELALAHVGSAHAAGAKILAGTDAFDSYVFPGFAIHDELTEFVAAGLSPLDALRAATIDAAVFSGVEDRFGSIAVGKAADMILLDADPLADIRNTQSINAVFFNGQYFDRSVLDDLLAFADRQAGSLRYNLHILWAALRSPLIRVQFAD